VNNFYSSITFQVR